MADLQRILSELVAAGEDDPRIAAIRRIMGTPGAQTKQYYAGDPSLGGYSPRDVMASRAMDRLDTMPPSGPPGFTPTFAPGEAPPYGQRRAEAFTRYAGDRPGTDSEIEHVYDTEDAGLGESEQDVIGTIPRREGPGVSEEEMQRMQERMDEDAGAMPGMMTGDLETDQAALERAYKLPSTPENRTRWQEMLRDFTRLHGQENVPPDVQEEETEAVDNPREEEAE